MPQCSVIKRNEERCRVSVETGVELCWAHDPRNASERKRITSRAGKSRPNRELVETKHDIRAVVEAVRDGSIESRVGGVVFQGYNTLLKALDVERRWYETGQLEERLEELEEALKTQRQKSANG